MTTIVKPRRTLAEEFGRIIIGRDGLPTASWESRELTTINTPMALHLAWAPDTVIRKIRVHRGASQALGNALYELNKKGQQWMDLWGVNVFGGCYGFRMNPDGGRLSPHSYGLAIDLAPHRNPLGQKWDGRRNMMPKECVEIFERHGWLWSGNAEVPDCGEFIFTR